MDRRGRAAGSAGFTLLEMLVVLSIMALAMAGAPAMLSGLDGFGLRAAADTITTTLREARVLAMQQGTSHVVTLDVRQLRFRTAAMAQFRALPGVVGSLDLSPGRLVGPDGLANLRFEPDGSATAVLITLRRGSRSASIASNGVTGQVERHD